MTLVFTLCSNNYLAQAIVLGKSLIKFNPVYKFIIGLVDKKDIRIDYSQLPFEIIQIEEINIPNLNELIHKYNITELNTAAKPFYFNYFFYTFPYNTIIYLDPDIYVYNKFEDLEDQLASFDIILTPHSTTPINDNKLPSENEFLNTGLYNLGFLAINKNENTKILIDWWSDRLVDKAYINLEKGMFTDQLWMNYTPLYFKNVLIYTHPGYNIGYWNLHERMLTKVKEEYYVNRSFSLIFFHYSGYSPIRPYSLSRYQNRFVLKDSTVLFELFSSYSKEVLCNNFNEFSKIPCYYFERKKALDLENYKFYKSSIPFLKRIIRGIILRIIRWFNINIDYYIK